MIALHSLGATILITVVDEQPNMDNCLNPIPSTPPFTMQSFKIRESLRAALLSYQIQVIGISRYGTSCVYMCINFIVRWRLKCILLDGCDKEMFMGIDWPETDLDVEVNVSCPCAEFAGSLAGRALRYCGGTYSQGARWDTAADITSCSALNSEITRRLCVAARVRIPS